MAFPLQRLQRAVRRKVPLRALRATLCACLLGLGFCLRAGAQSAEEYYHHGAQFFIFGENEKAKTEVQTGQRLYPNDAKLNELAALLKEQEQPPPSKGDKQDQNKDKDKDKDKDKNKGEKQKQDEQKEKQEKQDKDSQSQQDKEQQQKQDQQQQQQGQENKEQQKKKEDAQKPAPQQGQSSEQPEDAEGAPDKGRMIRMTPQQAIQLLEALKGEEKVMPFRPVLKTNRHERVIKDW